MLIHYGHQVAGHGILESYKGNVAKPLVQKEYNFYEATQQKYPDLFKWIPAYYGKTMIEQKGSIQRFFA